MHFVSEDTGDVRIITVQDDRIDAANAVAFKDQMGRLTDDLDGRIILDLSSVEFVDSSGLGAIVAVMKVLAPDHRLELAGLNETVGKVFRLTRMDSVFAIHADVSAAVSEPLDAA